MDPVIFVISPQLLQPTVLAPVFPDVPVGKVCMRAARRRVEPTPLVKRFIVRGATWELPKQVPKQCRPSAEPRRDKDWLPARIHRRRVIGGAEVLVREFRKPQTPIQTSQAGPFG